MLSSLDRQDTSLPAQQQAEDGTRMSQPTFEKVISKPLQLG
jgi:hypothetical protein